MARRSGKSLQIFFALQFSLQQLECFLHVVNNYWAENVTRVKTWPKVIWTDVVNSQTWVFYWLFNGVLLYHRVKCWKSYCNFFSYNYVKWLLLQSSSPPIFIKCLFYKELWYLPVQDTCLEGIQSLIKLFAIALRMANTLNVRPLVLLVPTEGIANGPRSFSCCPDTASNFFPK